MPKEEPFIDPKLIDEEKAFSAAKILFAPMSEAERIEFPYSDYDKSDPVLEALAYLCYYDGCNQ